MALVRRAFFVVASAALAASAMNLDTVCLSSDIPTLVKLGLLLDTAGAYGSVDSVKVTGGTCDSASANLYLSTVRFPLPLTARKMNSCSLSVDIAGLWDTVINACDINSVARFADNRQAIGAVRLMPLSGGVLWVSGVAPGETVAIEVFSADGARVARATRVGADAFVSMRRGGRILPAGRYVVCIRSAGRVTVAASLILAGN